MQHYTQKNMLVIIMFCSITHIHVREYKTRGAGLSECKHVHNKQIATYIIDNIVDYGHDFMQHN